MRNRISFTNLDPAVLNANVSAVGGTGGNGTGIPGAVGGYATVNANITGANAVNVTANAIGGAGGNTDIATGGNGTALDSTLVLEGISGHKHGWRPGHGEHDANRRRRHVARQ